MTNEIYYANIFMQKFASSGSEWFTMCNKLVTVRQENDWNGHKLHEKLCHLTLVSWRGNDVLFEYNSVKTCEKSNMLAIFSAGDE